MTERDPRFAAPARPAHPFRAADSHPPGAEMSPSIPERDAAGAGRDARSIVRFGRYLAIAS